MDGIEDCQFLELDSEQFVLGGPDYLPEKEYQGQDINDNENIEDLLNGILGEAAAPSVSVTDANIIPSNSTQNIAQNYDIEASQDQLSLPKMSEGSEAEMMRERLRKRAEKQRIYEIRKMEKIRKNIEKLRKRSEENFDKKYLGFGETKPPKKSKKKKEEKTMKTLKQANVSKEEKDFIQELMEYSESSVSSEVSN